MNKLTIIIPTVLTVVILMLIWPVINGGSEGYNTKNAGVVVSTAPVEEEVEEVVKPEQVSEPESATEQAVTEVIEQEELVEEKVEEIVDEPAATSGQVHVVTAEGLKYSPMVIQIQPGDTVAWENMSSHDTQSMEGLIPTGAEAWHSAMGENYQRTFNVEGIYVYKCTPHFGAGMGGVIIVGKPTNLAEIQAVEVKGAAKRLVKKALAVAVNL